MKVLAVCAPVEGADMARFAQLLPEEGAALHAMKASGTLLEAWSPGRPGAILILAADDLDAAQVIMSQLPLARAGLLAATLTPLADIGI